MKLQRAALVLIMFFFFIQLQTFAENLEHQSRLMQRRFYEVEMFTIFAM